MKIAKNNLHLHFEIKQCLSENMFRQAYVNLNWNLGKHSKFFRFKPYAHTATHI